MLRIGGQDEKICFVKFPYFLGFHKRKRTIFITIFIYGFPQETKEDFQKTFELALKLKAVSQDTNGTFRVSVFQFRPYHGTQLYNEILENTGIIHGCEFNQSISQFNGRSQFNFDFGNYSVESDEVLNEYIIKTQKLTEEKL